MSRYIDHVPLPSQVREKKVIVLSIGRNGTLGLYNAFKILGYKPYHMVDLVSNGVPHIKMMTEALRAKYFNQGKPYGREEFDKWMGDYDVITDVSGFFAEELAAAYPEAKFILTTREPSAWLVSLKRTFVHLIKTQRQFPLRYLRYFDSFMWNMSKQSEVMTRIIFKDKGVDDDESALQTFADQCIGLGH